MANMSDVYDEPSYIPLSFLSGFGRIIKLTAKPKYAPKAWTVMLPPASDIFFQRIKGQKHRKQN